MTELQNEAKENEKRQSEVTKEQKIQLQKLFQTLEEQKCEIARGAISSMKLRTTKTVTAVTELLVFGRFGKISPNLPKYFGSRNNLK